MKAYTLISLAALAVLAACTPPVGDCCIPENQSVQAAADEARDQAAQAAADARAARDDAARAAQAAKAASEKADRIFRQGQNK